MRQLSDTRLPKRAKLDFSKLAVVPPLKRIFFKCLQKFLKGHGLLLFAVLNYAETIHFICKVKKAAASGTKCFREQTFQEFVPEESLFPNEAGLLLF